MSAATISRADRDRMADDLHRLGLYATSYDVRSGRLALTDAVIHVRDYDLRRAEQTVADIRERNAESPPEPGTWGASALPRAEARRDALAGFVASWEKRRI